MLRLLFVLALVALGAKYAVKTAFGALLLYLWVAYFRPQYWAHQSAFLSSLDLSLWLGIFLLFRAVVSQTDRFRFDFRILLLIVFFCLSTLSMLVSPQMHYAQPFWQDFSKALVI